MDQEVSAKPFSLVVVASLSMLGGVLSAIDMVTSLTHGLLPINFGVLGILVGVGLLRYHRLWRTVALVFTWIAIDGALVVTIAVLVLDKPFNYHFFNRSGEVPTWVAIPLVVAAFLIAVWQYWVLTRPHIKQLFTEHGHAA